MQKYNLHSVEIDWVLKHELINLKHELINAAPIHLHSVEIDWVLRRGECHYITLSRIYTQ